MIQRVLSKAIKKNNLKKVNAILKKKTNLLNVILQDGKAALHIAVESNHLEMVQLLAKMKGINLNVLTNMPNTSSDGMTPVFMASYLNKVPISILNYLILQGADTSIATKNGQTPLTVAAYSNHSDRVNAIIASGKINENSVTTGGMTALTNAVEQGSATIVKAILAIPGLTTVNNKKINGESALFIAASQGFLKIVSLLLQVKDIDIEAKRVPGDQKTALEIATELGHADIVLYFKLRKKIPYNLLNPDLFSAPVPISSAEEKKEEKPPVTIHISSYNQYLKTKHKVPSQTNYLEYMSEMDVLLSKETKEGIILTDTEKKYIKGRKIWSDVLSNVDKFNTEYKVQHDVKSKIIARLQGLGYTNNPAGIYERAIEFIKYNSAIVFTFNASFLKQGLTDYQSLNLYEIKTQKTQEYFKYREDTEKKIFNILENNLKKEFFSNFHARPKYAALMLLDKHQIIEPVTNYGRSFLVFDDVMKLNALFFPCDSLDAIVTHKKDLLPSSYHHLDILLLQSFDILLGAIARRVTQGTLPLGYSKQYKTLNEGGYIEVCLPGVNLLNRDLVKHIHIDQTEYLMSSEEINAFSDLDIALTNATHSPYRLLCEEFMKCVENNNHTRIQDLLKHYPSLVRITNNVGEEPLHIAKQHGHHQLVKLFARFYDDVKVAQSEAPVPLANSLSTMGIYSQASTTHLNKPAVADVATKASPQCCSLM